MSEQGDDIIIKDEDLIVNEFNPGDYLESDEMATKYINTAFASGDSKQILFALGQVARYRGIDNISKQTGLPRSSLYRCFSDNGNPSFSSIHRVMQSLNLNLHVRL